MSSFPPRYIKASRMMELMQSRDRNGCPIPFEITYVRKSDGSVESFSDCHLTSRHSAGGTINIRCKGETHPRKLRVCLIISFNGHKVYY